MYRNSTVKEILKPGATLRFEDFSGVRAMHGDFKGANLEGADFKGAVFGQADFRGANLKWANFSGAKMGIAQFEGADLTDVNLDSVSVGGGGFPSLYRSLEGGLLPEAGWSMNLYGRDCDALRYFISLFASYLLRSRNKGDRDVYVNLYETVRSYGGPEEGGWWMDQDIPIKHRVIPIYQEPGDPGVWAGYIRRILTFVKAWEEEGHEVNFGNHRFSCAQREPDLSITFSEDEPYHPEPQDPRYT